jgi:type I restriction enzyme S subunit
MAQAVFKSWFVDFEPVRAKATAIAAGGSAEEANLSAMHAISGKTPEELATLKTTNPQAHAELLATANLFPHSFTPSELGDIPEGWEVKKVFDFGDIVCGKTPSKSKPEYFGSEIPFIKIPDMHNSVFITDTVEYLSNLGAESQKNKYLPKGSICVSCIATVGKVVITSKQSQTNQQINSIIPKREFYTIFIYFYMKHLEQKFHDLASGGSTTLNMNTSTFSKIEILKPNDEFLEKFDFMLKNLMEKILTNDLESKTLMQIRDSLLPKLLSGEIDVSNLNIEGAV